VSGGRRCRGRGGPVGRGLLWRAPGGVGGAARLLARRFGGPRASIEGTHVPARAIRRYSRRGAPTVAFERQRRREGLIVVRTVEYSGFLLERDAEPLPNPFPQELAGSARAALVDSLLAGHTPHPDQTRVRRALERFGFYWRRSGGRLAEAATEQIAARLGRQLDSVASWQN